jgi:hypothetical protein
MHKMKRNNRKLPHVKVYTRLGVSKIHGIGVFAIINIKKGTPIFSGDENTKMIWINKELIKKASKTIQKLYKDFCVLKGNQFGCPESFNNMTPSWYLNHSNNPNVFCDNDYNFYALRNIKANEELTANYDTYSDPI